MNVLANALPTGLLAVTLLAAAALLAVQPADAATAPPVLFGMDSGSVSAQAAAGVKPDYGTIWIGPWTLSSGWGGPDSQISGLRAQGVTPAIHLYYWGDDISPSCVESGCWSSLHNTWKDRARWQTLADQLTSHLNSRLGGAKAVVFLESEFNKRGISTYEPFDGYLAGMANRIKAAYPNAVVVLGFGNWQSGDWHNFDRAAAASQMVGIQAMRAATKDSAWSYDNLYAATLSGVRTLNGLFHKPVMLTDLALSSHPEPSYVTEQRDNLQKFFNGMQALRDNGVQAVIYRSWEDSPQMSTANYYGEAERHWGLAYPDGSHKSAASVWVYGVKALRSASASSPQQASPSPYGASFNPTTRGNEWWVETKATASPAPAKVEAKVDAGAWVALPKTDYGNWAKSLHAPVGSTVSFRATDPNGRVSNTQSFSWVAAPPSTSFPATFQPKAVGNDWWVEAKVTSDQAIAKVEARLNYGSWVALPRTDWGSFGDGLHAPNGTPVQFRATSGSGATATSGTYTWT